MGDDRAELAERLLEEADQVDSCGQRHRPWADDLRAAAVAVRARDALQARLDAIEAAVGSVDEFRRECDWLAGEGDPFVDRLLALAAALEAVPVPERPEPEPQMDLLQALNDSIVRVPTPTATPRPVHPRSRTMTDQTTTPAEVIAVS